MAKEYGRRPSEVLGITDEWAAYQLDVAALLNAYDDKADKRPAKTGDWRELARK
jgi:hypothetical protein